MKQIFSSLRVSSSLSLFGFQAFSVSGDSSCEWIYGFFFVFPHFSPKVYKQWVINLSRVDLLTRGNVTFNLIFPSFSFPCFHPPYKSQKVQKLHIYTYIYINHFFEIRNSSISVLLKKK